MIRLRAAEAVLDLPVPCEALCGWHEAVCVNVHAQKRPRETVGEQTGISPPHSPSSWGLTWSLQGLRVCCQPRLCRVPFCLPKS